MPQDQLLLVDDDQRILQALSLILKKNSYVVEQCQSGKEALTRLKTTPYDLILTDLKLPEISGLKILDEAKDRYPDISVIIMTGHATVDTAIEAMKNGAYDYITKPFKAGQVEITVSRALEEKGLRQENRKLKERLETQYQFHDLIGHSKPMQEVFQMVKRVAETQSTVLIQGESGTGKELVAKAIHYHSQRKNGTFIPINCGGIPETLLEDELFGHVEGAFTGAHTSRKGCFESAHKGTLFLDEIGNMSKKLQVKLLRVLQEGRYNPVGDDEEKTVDVRIIAATNTNLAKAVADGEFRQDLYYRMNVIPLSLPSMRERKEDIPLLVNHFLRSYCQQRDIEKTHFSQKAMQAMMNYGWPGNVREIENVVERAVTLCQKEIIDVEDLPEEISAVAESPVPLGELPTDGMSLRQILSQYEKNLILKALREVDWVKSRAATRLRLNRTTLIEKMKRLKIPLKGDVDEPHSIDATPS